MFHLALHIPAHNAFVFERPPAETASASVTVIRVPEPGGRFERERGANLLGPLPHSQDTVVLA